MCQNNLAHGIMDCPQVEGNCYQPCGMKNGIVIFYHSGTHPMSITSLEVGEVSCGYAIFPPSFFNHNKRS